jgi:molybdate transport system permease protein
VWIVAALGLALLVLPLVAVLIRAPWATLGGLVARGDVLQALGLSLLTGAISTALCLVLGVPLAIVLARAVSGPAGPRRLLRAAVTIPMVLPPVVGGIALLMLLGRSGVLGGALAVIGVTIPFTTGAVVIAQTFVAMPFLVFAVEGALRAGDRRAEAAAATLGATPFQVFRLITVPSVAPGIAAGAVLCFARALGEFGATITFAGSFPGTTRTLPIASYLALESDPDEAIALALLLIAVSVAVLLALRDRWLPGVRG